ncbi:MAG: APC family permease [Pseudorhodoplanes sp.]
MTIQATAAADTKTSGALRRTITWVDAVWIAMGVPTVVIFSIGGIAATVGTPSWVVWTVSVLFGFIQAFTYAEIAGMFPNKSGGASVYGAMAWIRYSKLIAPISVWTNWLAWSPALAIGSAIAAGSLMRIFFAVDDPINTWQYVLLDLGALKEGLAIRLNATFFVGLFVMLSVFAVQHHGILRTARVQTIAALAVLIPLLLVGLVPLLTGSILSTNLQPLVPIAHDAAGNVISGEWNRAGWTLFLGGLFIAAWSTYAIETTVCYTREFKNPASDTWKSIVAVGLICILFFVLVPFSFQGVLGLQGMLEPGIADGSGVAIAMAKMVGGGRIVESFLSATLILAVLLTVMTAMAGSSRTLYQGSVDGWLPRYLSHVNANGAPTRAMWTDLAFNVFLLAMSDYLFVLAVSNCCYIVFNFLNLNAGWIHRIDNADARRPWRASTALIVAGTALSFVNCVLLGAGANVWGPGTLISGIAASLLILPVFWFRHYVQDGGVFPASALASEPGGAQVLGPRKAGILPYVALAAGAATALLANQIFG